MFVDSDPARGESHGYNYDGWDPDRPDVFLYTGEGREGDQEIREGNKAILNHVADGRALRLFVADGYVEDTSARRNIYAGEFRLSETDTWFPATAPDDNGDERTVLFPTLELPLDHALAKTLTTASTSTPSFEQPLSPPTSSTPASPSTSHQPRPSADPKPPASSSRSPDVARIRTVKPDLWTDERLTECSVSARLLFIGALNFANDYGVISDSPKRLKMQVFPADTLEVEPLIEELVTVGLWQRGTHPDGRKVLLIRGFTKHQKVNRPNDGDFGDPEMWGALSKDSMSAHGADTESSPPEGTGREGNPPTPHTTPEDAWNEVAVAVGYRPAPTPNAGELAALRRALDRGWTIPDLLHACDGIADDPDIRSARRVAKQAIEDLANRVPTRPTVNANTKPCSTCQGTTWIYTNPDAPDASLAHCDACEGTGTIPAEPVDQEAW